MGGDQRNMSLHNKNDRSRNVFENSAGNMYIAVPGRGGVPSQYQSRNNLADDSHLWKNSSRGRSRLPEGNWRGGSQPRGGGTKSYRGGGNSFSRSGGSGYSYNSRGGGSTGGIGGSRRPPPPRYDDLLSSETADHKIERRMQMWGSGRGRSRGGSYSGRPNNKYIKDSRRNNTSTASFMGWQKVSIYDAAQHEAATVMEEVTAMVGESFDYHLLATEGNHVTFFLEDNQAIGKSLLELSKRLVMPNSSLRHIITVHPSNNPPFQPATTENLEKVKILMGERYSVHLNRLDLSEFHKDKNFRSIGLLFPLYVPSNLVSVGRLITANVPQVVEIDFSRNKLLNIDILGKALKECTSLTRLSFAHNKLKHVNKINHLKGLHVTELSLEGNPFVSKYKNIEEYISDVREIFPKLLVLDGKELPKPIGFEVDDGDASVPAFRPSYFCDDSSKALVIEFLKQYYQLFDSGDRSGLCAAYCEDAIFSLTSQLPENGPRAVTVDQQQLPNRNLKLKSSVDDRVELLVRGRKEIMDVINNKLPPTTHDLDSFIVDVPISKPQLMKVIVHGVHRREGIKNKSAQLRAFQRSLVVVPEGHGFCIANEQLYLTLASFDQIKRAFQSQPEASSSSAVPAVAMTPAPAGLEPQQLQMVEQFSTKSTMLPEFSRKCLEENAWDFDKAAALFLRLNGEGKIPPEYFKK